MFIKQLGLSVAAGWAMGRLSWPWPAGAAAPELRLALLADAHLKDGDDRRPEAQALARGVAEIRSLSPPPHLVLFAGDLAHRGRPDALDLGKEILADLPAPFWAVRGEGDHGPGGESAWVRRFGSPRFSQALGGTQVIGLDTLPERPSAKAIFEIGAIQRQWLARQLAGLHRETPLIILSHAPMAHLFHPWRQWTYDAPEVSRLLARFRRVLCLHGHVHGAGVVNVEGRGQGAWVSAKIPPIPPLEKGGVAAISPFAKEGRAEHPPLYKGDVGGFSEAWINFNNFNEVTWFSRNREPTTDTPIHFSLPATAWPLPPALQGTPAVIRPGLGPQGCGWALVTLSTTSRHFQPYLWRA